MYAKNQYELYHEIIYVTSVCDTPQSKVSVVHSVFILYQVLRTFREFDECFISCVLKLIR